MSEEQSGFKVTDRRLFNADGTPREVEREEAPAQAAQPPASESASSATEARASTAAATASEQPRAAAAERPSAASTMTSAPPAASSSQEESPEEGYEEGDIPGANDPASFINFLMSIASNAAAALGMMEHPVTGQRGVDLPLGKHGYVATDKLRSVLDYRLLASRRSGQWRIEALVAGY